MDRQSSDALLQELVRLELVEFIASFAFVELGEFMGPSKDALALLLDARRRACVCGSTVPKRVDEVLRLSFEGLLAELHQQSLVFRRELEQRAASKVPARVWQVLGLSTALAAGALASLARFLSDSGGAGASTTLSVASVRAAMACARRVRRKMPGVKISLGTAARRVS